MARPGPLAPSGRARAEEARRPRFVSSPFPSARGASSPEIDLALRDDLTGVFNRRYFRTMLDRDWPAWVKAGWEVSLLAVDLDGFKEVNDTWGHRAGDAVLQTVAEILRRNFRDGDRLIRYGGDEFVVVLPGAGPAVARELAERARLALDRLPLSDPDSGRPLGLSVSFSLGVASFPSDGETGELVLATADRRLYEEKRSRRENPPRPRRWLLRPTLGAIALAGASLATWWTLRPRPDAPASAPAVAPAAIERAPEAVRVGESAEIGRLREEVARLTQALAAERRSDEQRALQARIAELEARLVRPPAAAPAPPAAPSAVPPTATTSAATVPAPSPPPRQSRRRTEATRTRRARGRASSKRRSCSRRRSRSIRRSRASAGGRRRSPSRWWWTRRAG